LFWYYHEDRICKKHQLTLKEVVEEPFLLQAPWGRPTFIERVFAQKGITIKKPVTLGSREAVKAGIAAGYGISLLPRTVIDVELKAKTLKTKKLQNGRIEIGGELPVNTHGGLLSEAHIEGMLHITEAVKQLRGDRVEIERQVKDAKLGIVSGHSANLGAHATLILGRQSS
jgi:DNA-binding transcriptional LysR family regulator